MRSLEWGNSWTKNVEWRLLGAGDGGGRGQHFMGMVSVWEDEKLLEVTVVMAARHPDCA